MKINLTTALLSLSLVLTSSFALAADDAKAKSDAAGGKLAGKDQKFVMQAAQDGMLEVAMGKLAQSKGSSDHVKETGAMMVKDHTAANEELMAIAKSKGVMLPAELDEKHQKMVQKFEKMSGEEFDKAYLQELEKEHKKDVAAFEAASKSAQDPEVKAFAEKTLPTLKAHLDHVKMMNSQKKGA